MIRTLLRNLAGAVVDTIVDVVTARRKEDPTDAAIRQAYEDQHRQSGHLEGIPGEAIEVGSPLQRHIDSGKIDVEAFDRLANGPVLGRKSFIERIPGVVSSDPKEVDAQRADDRAWQRILVGFVAPPPIEDQHGVVANGGVYDFEKGDKLVDADGCTVAIVVNGGTVYLTGGAFVDVLWQVEKAERDARGPLHFKDAKWVGDGPRITIEELIDFDVKNGNLRKMFERSVRRAIDPSLHKLGMTEFFVKDVVGHGPVEPRDTFSGSGFADSGAIDEHFGRKP